MDDKCRISEMVNSLFSSMDLDRFEKLRPRIEAELLQKRALLDEVDTLRASLESPDLTVFDKSEIDRKILRAVRGILDWTSIKLRPMTPDPEQPVKPVAPAVRVDFAALAEESARLRRELRTLPAHPPVEHVRRERRLLEIERAVSAPAVR